MLKRTPFAVLVTGLAVVGCGTTVASTASQVGSGLDVTANSGSGGGSSGSTGGARLNIGGASPVATVGPSLGGSGLSGGPAGPAPVGGVTVGSSSSGGYATAANAPIKLGVVVGDPGKVLAAFGASGPSDIFAPWKAQINYINAHGGVAGHKIAPAYISVDGSAQDGDSAAQAACASATQDHKVDIVVSAGITLDSYLSCLQHAGVSSFDTTPWVADKVFLTQHPNLFAPDAISVDRYARALIQVSAARGILKKGDRLGVITEDCPWGPRVYNNVVVPLARSYGVGTETASFSCLKTLSGEAIADASRASQEAALKFRSAGVTHVMALTSGEGFLIDTFQTNASQQRYFPKYLVTSNAFPYNNSRQDGPVHFAADAEANMTGIGFLPFRDLGDAAKPATPGQAAEQAKCRAMDPNMGFSKQYTHDYDHWTQIDGFYAICDQLHALVGTLEANGVRYDVASLMSGFGEVQRGSASANTTVGNFAPFTNRRDGVGQTVGFSWDATAERFVYAGRPYTVA